MFLLFSATTASGSLLEERENSTLERLLCSRMTMDDLLMGKWCYLFDWSPPNHPDVCRRSGLFWAQSCRSLGSFCGHDFCYRVSCGELRFDDRSHVPDANSVGMGFDNPDSIDERSRREHGA